MFAAGGGRNYSSATGYTALYLCVCVGRLSGRLTTIVMDSLDYDSADFCVRLDDDLTFGVLLSAVTTRSYVEMRRGGFDVRAVRYEDLVARPLDMCRVVLAFCRLPVSLVELAVAAFDRDSQRNSGAAKSILRHFDEPQLTLRNKAKLNRLLKQFDMPLIGESDILEGTLTCC